VRALVFVLFILAVLWWWWGLKQAAILFTVTVRGGKVVRIRGRIPPRLMVEIKEIIERAGVTQARFQALSRSGQPILHFEGEMDPALAQQMRNVIGQFTVGQIRTGQKH
jgi:hypothetical protein